jgi:phosphatidylglycerol lysyltransferase
MTALRRDDSRAAALFWRYGKTASAFRVLGRELHHWFGQPEGVVAYASVSGAWVAAGEPVAGPDHVVPVAEAFVAEGRRHRQRVSFFSTEGNLATSPHFRRILIGEQPVWNPQHWSRHVNDHRSLREQLRRARAKGVTVRRVDNAWLASTIGRRTVSTLATRWFASRTMARMHFLVDVDPTTHAEWRQHYVAFRGDAPQALLSLAPVPARNGWLFEHVLRAPDAPNGTAELVIDAAMRALAVEQVTWTTLGLAPLAGDISGWLRTVKVLSRPLFNFAGLSTFKRKLRPDRWEPIYLAFPREASGILAMIDGLRAFAGGSLLRFALQTVQRGSPAVLRALEFGLVPWTLALALAPTSPWFPSGRIHAAWVIFDVALFLALYAIRTHRGATAAAMTRILAVAVTLDALGTLTQVILWNQHRIAGWLAGIIVLLATIAPACAAIALWGAARRLRQLHAA